MQADGTRFGMQQKMETVRSWWRHFAGAKLMAPTLNAETGNGDVDGRSTERIGEHGMVTRNDEEDHEKIRKRQRKTGLRIVTHRRWTCMKIFNETRLLLLSSTDGDDCDLTLGTGG